MASQWSAERTEHAPGNRIRLFVDQGNLDLTMEQVARERGLNWGGFDWTALPRWLVDEAARVCGISTPRYEGMNVYASTDPSDPGHEKRRGWLHWLDHQPGVQVEEFDLKPRRPPTCQNCYKLVDYCPHCGERLRLRQEKGVDVKIATDMADLAWHHSYDVAVLVSSDSDFIPMVEMLDTRGLKVIQAGFPPKGAALSRACWGQVDIYSGRRDLER